MIEKIDGFNARLQKLIEGFLCIASLIMLAVNLAQVIFRYIFHASILWSEELSTYLYVWIILFSLYAACREQSELNIAVLSFKDPKKMQVVETVRELLGLTACLALLAAQTLSEKSLIKEHGKTLAEEYGKSLAKEHRPSLTAEDDKREGGEL